MAVKIRVEEYVREDGSSPYRQWFNRLVARAVAKVTAAKVKLEAGNTSAAKWFRGIGEYRIDWGPGYRIYLAKDGESLIVLYAGGVKSGQDRDIQRALELHEEYQARKRRKSQTDP